MEAVLGGEPAVKSKAIDWLQVFRAPTLPAVLLPVMIGFLAGGGDAFGPLGLGFLLWAWAAHHLSFGHNSLLDAMGGHDEGKDPETHPLVSGAVSVESAQRVVYPGLVLVAAYGVVLSWLGGGSGFLSLASLLLFFATGYAYNGVSKVTRWSFLPISASFALLLLFGYFAVAEALSPQAALLASFVFLTMWFEADWEGNLKDIRTGEANMLRELGVGLELGGLAVGRARPYAWAVKLAGLGVITYAILRHAPTPFAVAAWATLAGVALISAHRLTTDQRWDRDRILAYTGSEELASFSLGLVAVAPAAGWGAVVALVAFSVAWVFALARITHGSSPEISRGRLAGRPGRRARSA